MTRKIPRDSSFLEWSQNIFVQSKYSYSIIKKGFWYSPIKIPFAQDRNVCKKIHQLYSHEKYSNVFDSQVLLSGLDEPHQYLENGVLFTGSAGHYHYLIDGLINLTAEMFNDYETIYVDADLSDDQTKFLKAYVLALTGKNINTEAIGSHVYGLLNICVPTNHLNNMVEKVKFFRQAISNMDALSCELKNSIVYVSRKNAKYRRLLNESELIETIQNEFNVICTSNESMSLFEQLSYYRNTKVILGPHGAGLTNLIFSKKPQLLMEFFYPPMQFFYKKLAESISSQFHQIECQTPFVNPEIMRIDNNDMTISTKAVTECLNNYLKNNKKFKLWPFFS
jgi:hypothetical protein